MKKLFAPLVIILLSFTGMFSQLDAQTNPSPQSLPYTQNFNSFTGATTAYPVGFQGWGFPTSPATNLTSSFNINASSTDQALTAATNASTSAFIGDMNGKMGVLATGSNIKTVCLAINTTASATILVSYLAATQRQEMTGVPPRIDELGVQYRIGTTGSFTNITGGTYQNLLGVSNLSGISGINSATISFQLPVACENQPIVQLRWIIRDVSGAGNRPSFSIDNISITGTLIISNNADLSSLVVNNSGFTSTATLSPVFTSGTTAYTTSVNNATSPVLLSFIKAQANSVVEAQINGGGYNSPLLALPLNVGVNTLNVKVTAQDGVTIKIYTIIITRAAPLTPSLNVTSALTGFGNVCTNMVTSANSFNLSGTDLNGSNISVAALSGYSFSETLGGSFTSMLSFSAGTVFTGKVIYVKFAPTNVQSYDGNILVSGGGLTNIPVVVSASGINSTATVNTISNLVTGTSATLSGSITINGCSSVTDYGFEYSTVSGFTNGTGISISASNLTSGSFSKTVSGLLGGTTYYLKAFATNSAGTSYGVQQSFTTSNVTPVVIASQPLFRYTENFADIANWSNNFITGIGANRFSSVVANTSGTIPDGIKITTATTSFSSGSSGGVQKGTGNILLLSTGSTDNSSSTAFEFYMDFTGVNAGTLSFDWASVNNTSGNRNGSLRVYSSIDGIIFTELPLASILNFTNFVPTTGSIISIALPSSFNNSPSARLRFYYNNGTGGTTGSRPKISIDNLTVTGLASTPCVTPSANPTSLTFGATTETTIQGNFIAASPAVNEYLVVMSTSSSLTSNPLNGQTYTFGDNIGDGSVIAKGSSLSFTATGLTGATTYYFFVFPVNSVCTGGPLYLATNFLTNDATTVAGLPNCTTPSLQPTNIIINTSINTVTGSFTGTAGDEYFVLQSTSSSLTSLPVNGIAYSSGTSLGNATVIQRSSNTGFTASGLSPETQYFYFIFSLNSHGCLNGPVYNTTSPLSTSATTLPLPTCITPTNQPSNLTFNASNNSVTATFNGTGTGYHYLVVMSTSPNMLSTPVDKMDYALGSILGGGTVVSNNTSTSFIANNLNNSTTYYFFVFSAHQNCTGGTKYLISSPLIGNATTTNTPINNYYFGNLHAHSDYSDGNKDNPGFTPANDYNYALGSLGMDFLGISEHNHFSSLDNPGNEIANYHLGVTQAATFNSTHPNFLALYGMEWGTISGGGHVLVYGDGLTDLFGWETGVNGNTGNNYDVYVPKSTYMGAEGLFKTINDYVAKNAFASLAHPNNSDYNNLSNLPYDLVADNAISGVAVENGPSTSTNTTYSNPASSMSYLWYFQKLLSKGYHLGPTIDHDNHNTTFGRTTPARTAVIAPTLTQTDIVKAVRDMHFYATEDIDAKVDFTINTRIMGSIFEDRNAPSISVNLTDATTNTSNALIRVMFGIPGTGILPVVVDSIFASSLIYVDNNLANHATGYYYIDITNGSSRIVTSPIWYTRTCASSSDTIATVCGSFNWYGTLYTSSTIISKVFTTVSGCDSTVTLHLTVNHSPTSATISLVGSDSGCPGSGVPFTLSVVEAGNGTVNSYQWLKEGIPVGTTLNGNFTALETGSYSVKVTNENNCFILSNSILATVIDVVAPVPNLLSLPVIIRECSATVIAPTATDNCVGTVTGTTTDQVSYNAQGTYIIHWTYSDGHGNSSFQNQTVIVADITFPIISSIGNFVFCASFVGNYSIPQIVATDNCSSVNVSYTISGATIRSGNGNDASGAFNTGLSTITWIVKDGVGNVSQKTAMVTINPIPNNIITAGSATTFCAGGNVTLQASAGTSWLWSNGATTQSITVNSSGNYSVNLTNTNSCSATSLTKSVTVNPLPTAIIIAASSTTICSGGSVALTASSGAFWLWSNGATTQSITVNSEGSYSVKVTNANGCSAISAATLVSVNSKPVVSISVSNADLFCNKLNLTANTTLSGAAYHWLSGSSTFATTQQISLGQLNGDGIYQVVVTVNGCTSAAASYEFKKQNLVSTYTIIAFDEVELGENNTVSSGSVGVTSPWGVAEFNKNSSVSSEGSFVKARYIDKKGSNINITNPINTAATGIMLPTMYFNMASTHYLPNKEVAQNSVSTVSGNYKNLTLKKGSRTTVTGNVFGTLRVEQGAQVTFTSSTINIDKLQVVKGPRIGYSYLHFAPDTKVLVSGSVSIGSQVYINPENKKLTFYIGDKKADEEKFSIKGGDTKVTANIYIPNGKLQVTGGYSYGNYGNGYGDCDRDDDDERYFGQGTSYVYMTGLFIAEEVEGKGKNVIWNSFDCSAPPVTLINSISPIVKQLNSFEKEVTTMEEELKITVLPNPTTSYFIIKLESKYESPLEMRVMDGNGRVIDAKSKIGSNSTIQIGHNYASGTYYAEMIQGTKRIIIQLIKGK